MTGLSRRSFLSGAVCACTAQPALARPRHDCMILDAASAGVFLDSVDARMYQHGDEPMIAKSGDPDFDYALAQTLARIADVLDVLPGFAYYDDGADLNAYATPEKRKRRADGTVLFGQGMLKKLMSSPDHPALAVATICAHEFGHIVQFKRKLADDLMAGQATHKRAELNADFMAGYFAGRRKLEKPEFQAAVFAETQYEWGDTAYNDPQHHGAPGERADAVVKGFHTAYVDRKSLDDAIPIGLAHVSRL